MDLDFVSVHKNAKKELGQYPAILTSRLVNNAYISQDICYVRTTYIKFSMTIFGQCHNVLNKNGRSNPEVMGSIPAEDGDFFFALCDLPFLTRANAQWEVNGFT